ncbi:Fluoroacetate dehalogenase [Pigmentiphaga humi]|uniref:Fluoroacetate dehalogenase n=1 Tax=Pigmentiphaga humi TaxID=2478468 RepID=A0A3P4B3P8_9BURK|nr:alpha/beta hydrolase [Pigmentiphaga humi]VCU70310.1 Fluoroacetate dehalogenase [Pigmentiphaga humi]
MFEGFSTADIETAGARIHLRHGGSGPPLLLLHGNPATHLSWHRIADRLAERYTVVAADLRGYGDSIGPRDGGARHEHYSFRAMAQDQVEVMRALGFDSFYVAGHDRGGRTVHRMCLDHPGRVRKAAILDILPSQHVWTHVDKKWATDAWHWTFMIQPEPFPERLMGSVPADWFMRHKLSKNGRGLDFFPKEVFDEYVRCFNEKTIHASCEDYRACASIDLEMDTADIQAGNKVAAPLLVLWGRHGGVGAAGDVLSIWQERAALPVVGGATESGHYVPEEDPESTYRWFVRFFQD